MLKHPKLTLGRVEQFVRSQLAERCYGDTIPLEITFCPEAHATEREARRKGPWRKVKPAFRYGPAYRTVWFRVTGRIPPPWAGAEVAMRAEVGGERTVWQGNRPIRGLDGPHPLFRVTETAEGGERIDYCVQAYTRNPECRVHGRELPRQNFVETVEKAELVQVRSDVVQLRYDCEFALDLAKALSEEDPSRAVLLRGLNDVCNAWAADPDDVAECRKIIRNALGSLGGGPKHTIYPVGHAHLDTAWLWPLAITHHKMAHTVATQLYLLDRYPEYVFVHSQAAQYEWIEREHPRLFEAIKAAIQRGQWEVLGSMWVEADCNLAGGEALVRQFLYGKRYFQARFGVDTEDMWLPDVFGYSAALPQILRKFGISFFLTQKISWNQFNPFPHHTFWWQGIDGTKVWTHFLPADTYCGNCTPSELLRSVRNYKDHARADQSLYVFGYGDGGGGPTEEHLELLRRAREASVLPVIEKGKRALTFFRESRSRSADLQTWVGELYFELHRGTYTSQAATKRANRECEFLLRDAELLWCFVDSFPKSYPSLELENAWKLLLLNQFHDILPGSSVREVYQDSAKDYEKVRRTARALIHTALKDVASKLDTSGMSRAVALFQNATVPSQVEIPWKDEKAPVAIRCGDECLPVQRVVDFDGPHIIFRTPECALGTVAVGDLVYDASVQRPRLKAAARRLENDEWSVRFDHHGNIASIQSLDDRPIEFIQPGRLANLFQLLDDKPLYWSAWDVDAFAFETAQDLVQSESFEVVERGPVRVAVEVVKRFGNSSIRQRISLGPTPGIRFDTEVDWQEEDKMLKVAFPIQVNACKATYEIQFGHIERPTHVNTTWDLARFEVPAQKWVDLGEGGHGVALINQGKYGHDVRNGVMRLSLLRSPKAPDPTCDMGLHRFTYVLLPHYEHFQHMGIVAAAYAINAPVHWAWLGRRSGESGTLPVFVSSEDRNLVVEAVKKAEDSNKLVVRLYECHNSRGSAELACAKRVRRAWLADLREKPLKPLEVTDGLVRFDYKPFEILTIMLEV